MTLILTLGNQEQFIQLSDRRLTSNGRLVDDESNKSGIFLCKDARHVFGFTGLARTGNFETKKWLFDALWDCSPPDYEISKIIQRLKVRATQDFKSIPALKRLKAKDKRLSVMFSGYLYYQKPPLGAWSLITNFQSVLEEKDYPEAWDSFEANYWTEHRPLDHEFTAIQRVGAWPAMTLEDEASLRELLQGLKPFEAIAGKAVKLVREMAERPKARGTIGKQLSVVVLRRDITSSVLIRYDSVDAGHMIYLPDQIIAIDDKRQNAISDISIWAKSSTGLEILSIPKVHRNAPCPCRSGKKYKLCHGR